MERKKGGRKKLPPHIKKIEKGINFRPDHIEFFVTRNNVSEDIRDLVDAWPEFKKYQKEKE